MKKELPLLALGLLVSGFMGCKKNEAEMAPPAAQPQVQAPVQTDQGQPAEDEQNPAEKEGK